MTKNIIELNEGIFETEVKNESKVVLIDFWASWCLPCQAVLPVLEKIAESLTDKIKVCKINIDDNQKLASGFGIMSIPTLIIFKDGKEQDRIIGALGEKGLRERLEKYLG